MSAEDASRIKSMSVDELKKEYKSRGLKYPKQGSGEGGKVLKRDLVNGLISSSKKSSPKKSSKKSSKKSPSKKSSPKRSTKKKKRTVRVKPCEDDELFLDLKTGECVESSSRKNIVYDEQLGVVGTQDEIDSYIEENGLGSKKIPRSPKKSAKRSPKRSPKRSSKKSSPKRSSKKSDSRSPKRSSKRSSKTSKTCVGKGLDEANGRVCNAETGKWRARVPEDDKRPRLLREGEPDIIGDLATLQNLQEILGGEIFEGADSSIDMETLRGYASELSEKKSRSRRPRRGRLPPKEPPVQYRENLKRV